MLGRTSTLWLTIFVLVGSLGLSPAVAHEEATTTVYLVRHAEKVRGPNVGRDPDLTEAGRARGRALGHTLADAEVDVIFTTQWKRTQQTAAALAERLGLEPKVVETTDDFIDKMKVLVHSQKGKTLVVVGHSDTTPELARALGAEQAPDIADDDFDNLYLLTITGEKTRFTRLHFGHPTP